MSALVNMVWIGNELGPIHAACIRSFLRHHYKVILHAYSKPIDTPKGVELFDAQKLMREDEVSIFKNKGLLAFASDIYRYRIQREGMGLYADCDVFCLKPIVEHDYLFAWESQNTIANGLLKIPHDSELLQNILTDSENPYFIPHWYDEKKKRKMRLKKTLGRRKHITDQPWGVIGPQLLTHHVKKLNLEHHAASIDLYLNLHYECVSLLYEEGLTISDLITRRSSALHLSSSVRPLKKITPNTPMYEIINS